MCDEWGGCGPLFLWSSFWVMGFCGARTLWFADNFEPLCQLGRMGLEFSGKVELWR